MPRLEGSRSRPQDGNAEDAESAECVRGNKFAFAPGAGQQAAAFPPLKGIALSRTAVTFSPSSARSVNESTERLSRHQVRPGRAAAARILAYSGTRRARSFAPHRRQLARTLPGAVQPLRPRGIGILGVAVAGRGCESVATRDQRPDSGPGGNGSAMSKPRSKPSKRSKVWAGGGVLRAGIPQSDPGQPARFLPGIRPRPFPDR